MSAGFWNFLLAILTSSGLIGFVAYLMRESLGKYFAKAVEHRFEKRLESFKANIRENELELNQIRSFLVSALRARDSALQMKRLEAAEMLLRARDAHSQLSILVEYMKILDTKKLLEDTGDPRISKFTDELLKPFYVDGKLKSLGEIDKTLPRLYLGENTLKLYDVYRDVILYAAFMLRLFGLSVPGKSKFIEMEVLSKKVLEVMPESKDGFDKWGDDYAYHCVNYLHDEILRSLRNEVFGADDLVRNTESMERVAIISRQAQINIRQSLEQTGLPDKLLKPDESIAAGSFSAKM